MKLNGITFEGPNEEILVLTRNGTDLVFKARAVLDYAPFDGLCPRPKPPIAKKPSGEEVPLVKDPGYSQQLNDWSSKRTNYIIITSLSATPGLEWDNVKIDAPDTWGNYQEELRKAFFSDQEIALILNLVWSVNGIDEGKLEQARKRFLAGQEAEASTDK